MAAFASCAGEGVHDGVEERDLSVALRPGPRRNGNGRKETEENGPEDEENEVDKRRMVFMDAQGLYNSYIIIFKIIKKCPLFYERSNTNQPLHDLT